MKFSMSSLVAAILPVVLVGCSSADPADTASVAPSSKVIQVVAAENFWGSIAAQLGGEHVKVTNVIDSPDADPHSYEPTTADGRAIATADLVLINGLGYDTWATKLAAANPNPNRTDLTVGALLKLEDGANPHRWYNPADIQSVTDQLVADYKKLDPADAAFFDQKKLEFETSALADYKATIAQIKAQYAGTPVGASESIVAMIAPALGLDLVTPPGFLKAISEGSDPTAADKATIDAQLKAKQIKVYIYNSQNATPDIQAQIAEAKAAGILVTTITETMSPAGDSWQQWQTNQLVALKDALDTATAK